MRSVAARVKAGIAYTLASGSITPVKHIISIDENPPHSCEGCGTTIDDENRFCSLDCQDSILKYELQGCSCHISPPCSYCMAYNPDLPKYPPEVRKVVREVLGLSNHTYVSANDFVELE